MLVRPRVLLYTENVIVKIKRETKQFKSLEFSLHCLNHGPKGLSFVYILFLTNIICILFIYYIGTYHSKYTHQ